MDERLKQERLSIINDLFIETDKFDEIYKQKTNEFIIVECEEGHRYMINYNVDNFNSQIIRGCPYCKGYKSKIIKECSYNNNLLNLEYFINNIPEAKGINNYEFYDLHENNILASNMTICSSKDITIRLKENGIDELEIIPIANTIKNVCTLISCHIAPYIKMRKGIVEKYIDYDKCNYNTYYMLENNCLITKELIDIINYFNFPIEYTYDSMYRLDMEYKWQEKIYERNINLDYFNIVLNEANYMYRNRRLHNEYQRVKIYKFINNKLNTKINKRLLDKEVRKKIKELKQEGEDILKTKDDFINQREELEKKITAIDKRIDKIKKELKNLTGEDIYIGPKPTLLEWCQQPENKELGDIIISQYLPRKNKKKLNEIEFDSDETIYIKGKHGSAYKTTPLTITKNKRVLPKLPKGTSYPELFIFYYLQSIFPEAIHKGKALKKVEYDITIPEKKTCIEYNGSAFHKGKYARPEIDANKVVLCKNYGVNYIRIEDDGDTFEPKCQDWLISVKYDDSKKQEQLMLICKFIVNNKLHCNKDGISIKEIEKKIRLYY